MLRTSPIQPRQINHDFTFEYQGEVLPIRESVLAVHGTTFETAWRNQALPVRITISSELSRSSVLIFVNYINELSLSPNLLSPSSVFEVLSLAASWQMSTLETMCERFINDHIDDLLVPACQFLRSTSQPTSRVETLLRTHLPRFASAKALVNLPLEMLNRIIVFPPDSQSHAFTQMFDLAVDAYRHHGPLASLLFQGVELRHLNQGQLVTLTSLEDFIPSFAADSLWKTTKGLLEDNAQLRVQWSASQAIQQAKNNEMEAKMANLMEAMSSMRELHCAQLNALKKEVDALAENSATKSDVANLCYRIANGLDLWEEDCESDVVSEAHSYPGQMNWLTREMDAIRANLVRKGEISNKTPSGKAPARKVPLTAKPMLPAKPAYALKSEVAAVQSQV
jgi:hypothetical protein